MSYDLHVLQPRTDYDIGEVVESGERSPVSPVAERLKERIVAALLASDPGLKRRTSNFEAIAKLHKLPVAEARKRFRQVDVDAEATGVQISLVDQGAVLGIPLWHKDGAARAAFEQVAACISIIIEAEPSYGVYDPQLKRFVAINDLNDMLAQYARIAGHTEGMLGRTPKKPRWWFW